MYVPPKAFNSIILFRMYVIKVINIGTVSLIPNIAAKAVNWTRMIMRDIPVQFVQKLNLLMLIEV